MTENVIYYTLYQDAKPSKMILDSIHLSLFSFFTLSRVYGAYLATSRFFIKIVKWRIVTYDEVLSKSSTFFFFFLKGVFVRFVQFLYNAKESMAEA